VRDVSKWSLDEQKKYFAARFAFAHRSQQCPHSVEVNGRQRVITWAHWFELSFGITLDDYQRQLSEDDHALGKATSEDRQSDAFPR
jgi:hypothetical protein